MDKQSLDTRQSLIRGGYWTISGLMMNSIGVLAISAILTRLLTPGAFGNYTLCLSLGLTLSTFSQVGMQRAIIRLVAQNVANHNQGVAKLYVAKSFLIVGLASLTTAFVFALLADSFAIYFFSADSLAVLKHWMPPLLLAMAVRMYAAEVFRGFKLIAAATIYSRLLNNVLMLLSLIFVYAVHPDMTVQMALGLLFFANLTVCLIAVMHLYVMLRKVPAEEPAPTRTLMGAGVSVMFTTVLVVAMQESPMWIASSVLGTELSSLYGVVLRTSMIIAVPLLLINSVLLPYIASLFQKGELRKLEEMIRTASTLATLMTFILWLFVIAGGKYYLLHVFGAFYVDAYVALIIAATGQLVNVLTGPTTALMMMSGKENHLAIITFIALLCGTVVTVLGVERLGAAGCALGFAIGLSTQSLLVWKYCDRVQGIKTHLSLTGCGHLSSAVRVLVSGRRSGSR